MKTFWEYSLRSEAVRVVGCAHQIANGFYRNNGFWVLPVGHRLTSKSTVAFPDLPYTTIPRFWEKSRRATYLHEYLRSKSEEEERLVGEVEKMLTKGGLPKPRFEKARGEWEAAGEKIIGELEKIIPEKIGAVKSVTIYPTVVGTSVSFNWSKDLTDIIVFWRDDQGIGEIVEGIVTALTRSDVYEDLSGGWRESEMVVDWLLTKSSLAKTLEKYGGFEPTSRLWGRKQDARILKESEVFLKKIGAPIAEKLFGLEGEGVVIGGRKVDLTGREVKILKLLVESANQVVSFDKLGEVAGMGEEDFSLWAIAKVIQRLRDKLEGMGISGSYIQTCRGVGYWLRN